MKSRLPAEVFACLTGFVAIVGPLPSAHAGEPYAALHAPAGGVAGGGRVISADGQITLDLTVGDAIGGGISDVSASGVRFRHNYIGQLYDVTTVEVSATPTTVVEGGTRQLTTSVTLDDATTLEPDPDAFDWSHSPAIVSIDPSTGVARADVVYENTATSVAATYAGVTSPNLALMVLNVDPDNYASYGADGIDDTWQIVHFGLPPNANAAPVIDFDGDGDDNTKEFLFGFSPVDAADFFQMTVAVASDPTRVDLLLNRVIPGRTYTIRRSEDLVTYPIAAVPAFSVAAPATDFSITDVPAPDGPFFLIVEAARP